MNQAHDLLQCPICGEWYLPKTTATGRMVDHCPSVVSPSFPDVGKTVDVEV